MPTKRDKRLFSLAELLAAELNKSKGDVQPEDILSFMQCNVPVSEDESSEEYEDMIQEHNQKPAGRGTSAIARLRKSLGFVDGDSIISVIEKAADAFDRLTALDDDLRWILSRPSFWCIHPAAVLRADGKQIKTRAEDEQASVIHWLLNLYITHGSGFEQAMKSEAKRIKEKVDQLVESASE